MSGDIHANLDAGIEKLGEAPIEPAIEAWHDIMGDMTSIAQDIEQLAGRVLQSGYDTHDAITLSRAAMGDTERASGFFWAATEGSESDEAVQLNAAHNRLSADARLPYDPGRMSNEEVIKGLDALRSAARYLGEAAIYASQAYNAAGELRPGRNAVNHAADNYRDHIRRTIG